MIVPSTMRPFRIEPPTIKAWKRLSSENVGTYRVFGVEKQQFIDSAGTVRPPVFSIVCSDWCNVIPITTNDELVLVWQHRFGTDAFSLEIPGGMVDQGEKAIDAARRELLEETGYGASQMEPLLIVHPNPALQGNRCHTFLARDVRLVGEQRFDDLEECEVALVPTEHIPRLLDEGHITHALVVVALEAFLRSGRGGVVTNFRAG